MMKYIVYVVLLFGVCSSSLYKQPNKRFKAKRQDEDLSSSFNSEAHYSALQGCYKALGQCARDLTGFLSDRPEPRVFAELRRDGISGICLSVNKGLQCGRAVLDAGKCSAISHVYSEDQYRRLLDAYEFICDKSFDVINNNKQCLFDETVAEGIAMCVQTNKVKGGYCNRSLLMACTEDLIERVGGKCKTEAVQLIREFFEFFHYGYNGCSER